MRKSDKRMIRLMFSFVIGILFKILEKSWGSDASEEFKSDYAELSWKLEDWVGEE